MQPDKPPAPSSLDDINTDLLNSIQEFCQLLQTQTQPTQATPILTTYTPLLFHSAPPQRQPTSQPNNPLCRLSYLMSSIPVLKDKPPPVSKNQPTPPVSKNQPTPTIQISMPSPESS